MIICLLRTFLENALKKQNFPFSPLSLHCACISVGNSVFFFFKLAAPMHVLFFKVARSPFKQKYGIQFGFPLSIIMIIPLIHCPRKILNRLSKTMHSAASLRKKGKTPSLPLHAHSKHMGRRKVLLGQGIF